MRAAFVLCALSLGAAGCNKTPGGYGVHFTLLLDGSISDGDSKAVSTLELTTESSVEPFSATLDAKDRFSDRKAELTYRPKVTGGTLAFDFKVRDGGGKLLGVGSTEVALVPGVMVSATVTLVNPASISRDMGPNYDFLMVDLAMPDMSTPPPPPDMTKPPPPPDMVMLPNPDMVMPPPPPDMSVIPDAMGD